MKCITILFCLSCVFVVNVCNASRVLELSDKFSDVRRDGGRWLVMFYAPWCGHCKRLEPVWGHVAQALYRTPIRVGKVDCTRFINLAKEFSIAGYPTIKYIDGEDEHTYHGDRTKEEIVNFALRMSGPPVQEITRTESLSNIKDTTNLFFVHVGFQDGSLWEAYHSAATKLQPHAFFYSVSLEVASQHMDVEQTPTLFVYKEKSHYFFESDVQEEHLNDTVFNWLNEERFETFPKVTRGNINQILNTKKYIVLVVVEENRVQQIPQEMIEFRDMVESVIRKKRDKFHKSFQFGWIGSPELANSIAMTILPLPHLLVLNSTTNHHHFPQDEPSQLTPDAIDLFLEQIVNQNAPAYGGNGFIVQVYRTYFEARTALADMWRGNPVLTVVLFSLPLGFLSLILYSICCQDILDADEEDSEEQHEKNE